MFYPPAFHELLNPSQELNGRRIKFCWTEPRTVRLIYLWGLYEMRGGVAMVFFFFLSDVWRGSGGVGVNGVGGVGLGRGFLC